MRRKKLCPMFMVEVEMDQAQLIRCIEQQLENLAHFDDELAYEYENDLYYSDFMDEPIIEQFTPQLLKELEDLVYELDNE